MSRGHCNAIPVSRRPERTELPYADNLVTVLVVDAGAPGDVRKAFRRRAATAFAPGRRTNEAMLPYRAGAGRSKTHSVDASQ